jgi:hypothetical protein
MGEARPRGRLQIGDEPPVVVVQFRFVAVRQIAQVLPDVTKCDFYSHASP